MDMCSNILLTVDFAIIVRIESVFSTNIGQISSLNVQYFISLLKLAQRHPVVNAHSSAQLSSFDGASRYISCWPSRRKPTMFVAFNGRNSSNEVPGLHVIIRTDDTTRAVCIWKKLHWHMITSSNANIFRVTGPLWGESTCHRWIPLTKASDAVLWYFLWSRPEQTSEQTIETLVIWNAIALIMTSL